MVLINDKKYACATCIKGHRVSSCTHTERPLFEVKKKGRPSTQCQFCKEKRKGSKGSGSVHTACQCGDLKAASRKASVAAPEPIQLPPPTTTTPSTQSPASETKKGVPGSTPTFPNGLRDVHDMAAAAEALTDLGGESGQLSERNLQNLLNPCHCRITGKCKCCAPKRRPPSPAPSPPRRESDASQVTDSLVEMFKAKATTSTRATVPDGTISPSYATQRGLQRLVTSSEILASPEARHHPAHTAPSVHKVRLYSPYATNGTPARHGKGRSASVSSAASSQWPSSAASPRPPPSRLRPLADMNKFLGAVFNEDGSIASQIPRSALGLPGIHTFDAMAENGGVKMEPMELDGDAPVAFPTAEEVMIGGCTCGEGCQCPGCATHDNKPASGQQSHAPGEPCGESCKSCFNCGDHMAIPSGVASIEQLIQMAAANVPAPPRRAKSNNYLDPHDTRILPPAAQMSEDVGRAFGVVQLKPLECCNGRCQCSPGECKCDKDCCGCCKGCQCGDDEDAVMADGDHDEQQAAPAKSCCSSTSTAPSVQSTHLQPGARAQVSPDPHSPLNRSAQPSPVSPQYLAPPQSGGLPSPNRTSPSPGHRRASSVARAKEAAGGVRRMSTSQIHPPASLQRSTSLGSKPTSKLLALHPQHPRPILPKPTTNAAARRPSGSRSGSISSRQPSPIMLPTSSQPSSHSSPVPPTMSLPAPMESAQPPTLSERIEGMSIGVDDIASALNASEVDFMSYINSLIGSSDGENASGQQIQSDVNNPPDLLLNGSQAIATSPGNDIGASMGDIQQLIAATLEQQGILANRYDYQDPAAPDFGDFAFIPPDPQQSSQPFPQYNFGNPQDINALQLGPTDPPTYDDNVLYQAALSLQVPSLQTGGSSPSSGHVSDVSLPPPHSPQPQTNPDIIDLSKPLNPADIDRILQALNRQAVPPPHRPPSAGSEDPFEQYMLDPQTGVQDWLQVPGMPGAK